MPKRRSFLQTWSHLLGEIVNGKLLYSDININHEKNLHNPTTHPSFFGERFQLSNIKSNYLVHITQLTFTCSNLAVETLEKGVSCSKLTINTPERHQ